MSEQELEAKANQMATDGYAQGTKTNYNCGWENFKAVCELYGWQPVPASSRTLRLYTVHVFQSEPISGRTFDNRILAIKAAHTLMGFTLDTSRPVMPRLYLMKKAFKTARPPKAQAKAAITMNVLELMLSKMGDSTLDQRTVRAVITFAYSGMLRVSEYAYGAKMRNKPRLGNISKLSNEIMVYNFAHSKMNQLAQAEKVVMCCRCPRACAIHELLAMLRLRQNTKLSDPLFLLSSGRVPNERDINDWIKTLCSRCGIEPELVSSHCLRAGAITDALAAGIADTVVQCMSRHKNLNSMVPYKKFSSATAGAVMSEKYRTFDAKSW